MVGTDGAPDFEDAMAELVPVIAASPGYLGHTVQRSIETPGRYVLLVRWETLDDHVVGFRTSPSFTKWTTRLGSHRDGARVEHLETVLANGWDVGA